MTDALARLYLTCLRWLKARLRLAKQAGLPTAAIRIEYRRVADEAARALEESL